MALTLSIVDETLPGKRRCVGDFHFDTETLTLRELISSRVRQEVERFNRSDVEVFGSLIELEEIERLLNGVRERPVLDWEKQVAKAITAFQGNGFLVLVDDRQVTDWFGLASRPFIVFFATLIFWRFPRRSLLGSRNGHIVLAKRSSYVPPSLCRLCCFDGRIRSSHRANFDPRPAPGSPHAADTRSRQPRIRQGKGIAGRR